MKIQTKLMQIIVAAIACAGLASVASAAQQQRRSYQPPPMASRPMPPRPMGSSGHVSNPNLTRAPFRSLPKNQVNKPYALSKTAGLNKAVTANGSKATNKSTTFNKTGSLSNKTSALNKNIGSSASVNKNTTINKNTTLAKNTTLNKNVASNKTGKFRPIAASTPRPNMRTMPYRAGQPIANSQNWKGSKYAVFRDYRPVWQTRGWWVNHYDTIVFVSGGWYAWEAGYWIPAWGYDAEAVYYYDGPIACGCTAVEAAPPPDPCQIVANVQSVLQQQGYYQGDIDGVLSLDTQTALSAYQQAQGLEVTGAVDQPTLESLGLA
jgi:hypothetical protein